jgi:hypothetical protein
MSLTASDSSVTRKPKVNPILERSNMDSLRNEIIEAQKSRSDLMKWKLVLVSGLGAVGLRLTDIPDDTTVKHVSGIVLCLIPFACSYVDALCRHLFCRILVIGRFLALHDNSDPNLLCKYEQFTKSAREMKFTWLKVKKPYLSAFGFENLILPVSSVVLGIFLIIISDYFEGIEKFMIWISGIVGVILPILIDYFFRLQRNQINMLLEIQDSECRKLA